ncbi:MAG: DUF2314 domain-containing protein [Rhodobacteraceae bacterium]|nr:DUF2314 domain-containing protein [Paracoccaceae bacterium]
MLRVLSTATLLGLTGLAPVYAVGTVVQERQEDPQLAVASQKARATLDLFLDKAMQGRTATPDAAVLVLVPTETDPEALWVKDFKIKWNGRWVGAMANQPVAIPGRSAGERIRFDRGSVVDWSYKLEGKLYGHYTTRVLLTRQSTATRGQYEPLLAPTTLPEEWR